MKAKSKRARQGYLSNFLGLPTRIIVLLILFAVILFPFYWLVTNAFKVEQEYFSKPPIIFPSILTTQNFIDIVQKYELLKGLINSILIASGATFMTVLFGSLASYSLINGMLPRKIKGVFAGWFLVQKMYPAIVVAVPVFYIIRTLRLMDNIMALVLMNTSFNLPLVILLMIGFYQEAPFEVEEQSMLDGCNLPQRYFYITTPMVKSGLIATGMLTFVFSWNEFLYAVILTVHKSKPLTVLIAGFITDKSLIWGPMAAMGCVVVFPVLLIMWLMQRDFISGISAGALKG
ncbi:MAG: carbohydrate ABC transporter permease [Spirochaetaceae bacterium]|nr:MAG: carbohydrate ABC transporter permease [Spirochaetaceae bacterium]